MLTAGAAGTDPVDLVFEALRQAGGEVVQLGIPVEPGTACWMEAWTGGPFSDWHRASCLASLAPWTYYCRACWQASTLDTALLREIAFGGLLLGPPRGTTSRPDPDQVIAEAYVQAVILSDDRDVARFQGERLSPAVDQTSK